MAIETILFYGGIGLLFIAAVGSIAAALLCRAYKNRLQQDLDKEYGAIPK